MVNSILHNGAPEAKNILFLAHGAGAFMDSPFMETIAQKISGDDIYVLRFEFPYMMARRASGGKRPPNPMEKLMSCYREVVAAQSQLGRRIFIGGKSMGGRVAAMISAEKADNIAGIVCLGYPFHPVGKPDRLRLDPLRLGWCHRPTLIVQGTRDALGSVGEVAQYDLSPQVQFQWLEDGDHSFKPRKSSGLSHENALSMASCGVRQFILSQGVTA